MEHQLLLIKNHPDLTPPAGIVRISQRICRKEKIRPGDAVRISANDISSGFIIREVWQTNNQEPESLIDMDYRSRYELGITANYGKKVTLDLKKTYKYRLYWNHPEHSLRLGFRLGVVGLLIGIISLGIAIVPKVVGQ